jgi:hypothetical protein
MSDTGAAGGQRPAALFSVDGWTLVEQMDAGCAEFDLAARIDVLDDPDTTDFRPMRFATGIMLPGSTERQIVKMVNSYDRRFDDRRPIVA